MPDGEAYFLEQEGDEYVLYDVSGESRDEVVRLTEYAASEVYVALHSLLLHVDPLSLLNGKPVVEVADDNEVVELTPGETVEIGGVEVRARETVRTC